MLTSPSLLSFRARRRPAWCWPPARTKYRGEDRRRRNHWIKALCSGALVAQWLEGARKFDPDQLKVDSAFCPSEVGQMRTQIVGGQDGDSVIYRLERAAKHRPRLLGEQEADSVNCLERAGKHWEAGYKSKGYCYFLFTLIKLEGRGGGFERKPKPSKEMAIQERDGQNLPNVPRMPLEGLLALVAPQSSFKQKGVNVMHNEATFWSPSSSSSSSSLEHPKKRKHLFSSTEGREEERGEIEKEGRHGKERRKVREKEGKGEKGRK
ncbi:hypothetical protein L345_10178, partial [Ophiophagus hannah]